MKKIAIIVLNWNGKQFLRECLDSLINQTYIDRAIYLVDNGSKDGSVEWVAENYPEVNLIPLPQNLGFAGGMNEGIKRTTEEFVALVNNDTKALVNWLEELYNGMLSDPQIGICASKMLFYYSPDIINAVGDGYWCDGVSYNRGYKEKDLGQYDKSEYVFGACAGAALYRRSMLEKIGLFDEDYFESYEDADISFRAQLMGYKCLYVNLAIIYHLVGATVGGFPQEHFRNSIRNRYFTLIKNMPVALLVRYLPHLFFGEIINTTLFLLLKGWVGRKAYFKAHWDLFKSWHQLLIKRKSIQGQRKVANEYIKSIVASKGWKDYLSIIRGIRRTKS